MLAFALIKFCPLALIGSNRLCQLGGARLPGRRVSRWSSPAQALDSFAAVGKVQLFGRGRAPSDVPPVPGFATILLLPRPLPSG
jgi:hypothetical protein